MPQWFLSMTRWLARLTALLLAGGYGLLLAGEVIHPHSGPPTQLREWIGIALCTSVVVAALFACKWEVAGGIASLAALAAFALVVQLHNYGVVLVAAIPGVLLLLDWTLRRYAASHLPAHTT